MKKYKYDAHYMEIAKTIAKMSFAERAKVGSLAVLESGLMVEGWNGMPAGMDNVCEKDNVTLPEVLHAESNLLSKISKSTESSEGATVYCTLSPCMDCAKMMYQAGIKRVVYLNEYKKGMDGVNFLKSRNIEVEKLT